MTVTAEFNIHTIDTGFGGVQFDAAYLIVQAQRGALIDCGTSLSVPQMLAAVQAAGLAPAQIEWLILTHVHLDHAGGAGTLLQHLPNAQALVHPRGAPHLIDPTRLIAGATAVYGEAEMARSYGVIAPVPAERVVEAVDGYTVMLGARALRTIDTRGMHAIICACGMRVAAAGLPVIPSACRIGNWTVPGVPSSCPPRRRYSSSPRRCCSR